MSTPGIGPSGGIPDSKPPADWKWLRPEQCTKVPAYASMATSILSRRFGFAGDAPEEYVRVYQGVPTFRCEPRDDELLKKGARAQCEAIATLESEVRRMRDYYGALESTFRRFEREAKDVIINQSRRIDALAEENSQLRSELDDLTARG